ncbi:hypothetical protein [Pseudarthrobacter sp. PvP090]|uniref:hypothetical protein n=1 Tax=Pseudarthrobacter sp. PvP090 TaxID=3156393 RepID=UPI0033967C6C
MFWTPYWFNDCNPKSVMNNVKTCSRNVRVANGEAVLQLTDAESGALLSTNPKDGAPGHAGFEFTSGFAEARIYFPGTCSSRIPNWPAWWTVGQRFPHTGEIDIAEALSGDMWSVYHSAEGKKSRNVPDCLAGAYHSTVCTGRPEPTTSTTTAGSFTPMPRRTATARVIYSSMWAFRGVRGFSVSGAA